MRGWRCGGRSFRQPILKSSITVDMILKFRIDRRITDVRRGRKRVPICKGGVEVERGPAFSGIRPLQVFIPFFFSFARPTDLPSQDTGRWETKHFIGMACKKYCYKLSRLSYNKIQNMQIHHQHSLFAQEHSPTKSTRS